ncbi:hypothetical protein Ct61P_06156 [Colletotrichum tofieldiae]|nr:hypothetical protein Ct61P_06156 [Colletotrichum tofieldiae]
MSDAGPGSKLNVCTAEVCLRIRSTAHPEYVSGATSALVQPSRPSAGSSDAIAGRPVGVAASLSAAVACFRLLAQLPRP